MSLLKEIPFLVRATLDKCFSMLISKIRDLPFLMDEDIKGRIRHERLQKIRHYNRKKKKKHEEQSEEEEESKDPSTSPSKPPTVKQKPKLKSPSSMSQEEMVEMQDMIMNHVPKVYIMEDGSNKPEPFKSGMTETGTVEGTVKARPVSKKSIPSILKRSPVKPRPVKRVTAADVEAMTSSILKKRTAMKHEPKVIKPKKVKQAKKKVEKQKPNVIGYGRLPTATNISVTQSVSSGLQKPLKKTKPS